MISKFPSILKILLMTQVLKNFRFVLLDSSGKAHTLRRGGNGFQNFSAPCPHRTFLISFVSLVYCRKYRETTRSILPGFCTPKRTHKRNYFTACILFVAYFINRYV